MTPSKRLLTMLAPNRVRELGEIATLAGSIEFRVERIIWLLSSENVAGVYPTTDARPISALIISINNLSENITDISFRKTVKLWTAIATLAFRCRNSILHGLVVVYDEHNAEFKTNTSWEGEVRKRKRASFHLTDHTLGLLSEIFQLLYDNILATECILENRLNYRDFFTDNILQNMSKHYSIVNEIVDLAAAYSSEKY